MFAVIYQGYVKADCEAEYIKAWNLIATYFVQNRGSLGSSLHRGEKGLWVAYSRWPNKAIRDASWPRQDEDPSNQLPLEIQEAILILKNCFENQLPEICLEIIHEIK